MVGVNLSLLGILWSVAGGNLVSDVGAPTGNSVGVLGNLTVTTCRTVSMLNHTADNTAFGMSKMLGCSTGKGRDTAFVVSMTEVTDILVAIIAVNMTFGNFTKSGSLKGYGIAVSRVIYVYNR